MSIFVVEGRWELTGQVVLRVRGPDAVAFLHGQLTNTVERLDGGSARPFGYCTAKGRLLANGVIWRDPVEGLRLMVSRDLAERLSARLRLFVLRAKVVLEEEEDTCVWGVAGADAMPAALRDAPAWTRMDDGGLNWIVAPFSGARGGDALPRTVPMAWCIGPRTPDTVPSPAHASAWAGVRVLGGWPWIRTATSELFLPSALNMDLNGSIDFQKGCYPGQEVIARSHYRGTPKRRMACGTAPWRRDSPVPEFKDLYAAGDTGGRPLGRVIEAIGVGDTLCVAAEISLSDWPATRYAAGAPDGPVLRLQAPPGAQD